MARRTVQDGYYLSDAIALYHENRTHLAENTQRAGVSTLNRFRKIVCEGCPPAESMKNGEGQGDGQPDRLVENIDFRVIEQWHRLNSAYVDRRGRVQPRSASSVSTDMAHVRTFFAWAKNMGMLPVRAALPTENLVKPTVRRRKFTRVGQDKWAEIIAGAGNPRDKYMFVFAAYCGVRFKSEASLFTVAQAWEFLKSESMAVFRQKTTDDDDLPVSIELIEATREYLAWYEEQVIAQGAKQLEPWFLLFPRFRNSPSVPGGIKIAVDEKISRPDVQIKNTLANAGLDAPREGCHTPRRWYATAMYVEACSRADLPEGHSDRLVGITPIELVASMLGHTSTVNTWKYIGVTPTRDARNKALQGRYAFRANRPVEAQVEAAERGIAIVTKTRHLSAVRDVS